MDLYLWTKALHVISLIAWMAGIFYLPRLFIYHTEAEKGSDKSETFKVMEEKLLRVIMNPAMIATWLFGLLLVFYFGVIDWSEDIWFHVKFMLVIGMTVFHMFLARWRKDFAADANQRSGKFYRIMNEAPTVLMIFIVILVIVKPF